MRLIPLLCALAFAPACKSQVGGVEAVLVSGPTNEARFDTALSRVAVSSLSADAAKTLEGVDGVIVADAPDKVSGVPSKVTLKPLLGADVRAALLAPDEGAAAKLLRDQNVRMVVLHRPVVASLDRGRDVLSRLYNHDQLALFQLVRVTPDLLLYQVLDKPVVFPPQLAAFSTAYLRARLAGKAPQRMPEIPSETGKWTLMATLRSGSGGREMAIAFGSDSNLQRALEELVADLERDHRRDVEILGFTPLSQDIDHLVVEIHRVFERATVERRDELFLEDLWEMGIDGAYVMTKDQKERGFLPGAAAYTRSIRDADGFLREAASQGGMSERRPWRDPEALLELIRTIHYIDVPGKGLSPLYRGVAPVPLESVTVPAVKQAILLSGNWYLANLAPNGQVTYKFWPSENRYSDEYNHVRHELATWNLVQAWRLDPRPEYLDGAKLALKWTNEGLKDEGDMSFYEYDNNQKLGSAVVGLLGLIDLAEATGDHQYDDLMKRLGRFTKFMQEEDGTFRGYYVPPDHPYYNQKNDIVPGEAALALVRLAEYFDDNSWIDGLPRYWTYYKPWFHERASKIDKTQPWPAYQYDNDTRLELVQFGPWTVMAANAYHRRTGDVEVANFGLELARWMIESYQWDSERAPFPDYIGGYYKMPSELPAMQAFCYAEGTAAAYQLALRMAPDQAPWFERKTREAVRFGLNMQYNALNIYPFSRGAEVLGGIRYAMNETKVRIDYVYHAQSAMVQWLEGAMSDPNLAAEIKDPAPQDTAGRPGAPGEPPPGLLAPGAAAPGAATPGAAVVPPAAPGAGPRGVPFQPGVGGRPLLQGGKGHGDDDGGE